MDDHTVFIGILYVRGWNGISIEDISCALNLITRLVTITSNRNSFTHNIMTNMQVLKLYREYLRGF